MYFNTIIIETRFIGQLFVEFFKQFILLKKIGHLCSGWLGV